MSEFTVTLCSLAVLANGLTAAGATWFEQDQLYDLR